MKIALPFLLLPFGAQSFSISMLSVPSRFARQSTLTQAAFRSRHTFLALTTTTTTSSSSSSSSGDMTTTTTSTDDATKKTIIPVGPELPPVPATCKRLFLVRHGEVINPGGDKAVFYGGADVPLSDLGKEEAKAAALYLQQFDLSFIVSSPLSRAVFGAKQVLTLQQAMKSSSHHELLILDGLTELNRGAWCGKTKEEIGEELMKRFDACDESVTPEGGESYPALKRRVLEARDEVLRRLTPGQAACVVSHLQVTRSILSEALGISTENMSELQVATASITCIDYDDTSDPPVPPVVRYQSFKPEVGLAKAKDGAN